MRCHCFLAGSIVVILIVHQDRVFAFEAEGQSPVAADAHRPVPFKVTFQRMPPPNLPGSYSSGVDARFKVVSRMRSRASCFGWMPAFEPVVKNFSMPRCRNVLIAAGA
jgi:hypothetical protein